jgi:hypothetical protein
LGTRIEETTVDNINWMELDVVDDVWLWGRNSSLEHGHWSKVQVILVDIGVFNTKSSWRARDFQKVSMKGWDKGCISMLGSTYDITPIGRAKFLLALKEAALQYVKIESKNPPSLDDESSENGRAFLVRINTMTI